MTQRRMRFAVAQFNVDYSRSCNTKIAETWVKTAAKKRANLLLLPELHTLPYFCVNEDPGTFDLAEPLSGGTRRWLCRMSERYALIIVATIFERASVGTYYNTALVAENGKIAGLYRKTHIPQDPGYHEKYYFTPGRENYLPIQTSLGQLGVLICWDQWFPEAARAMALAGADILLYPSAIGWSANDSTEEKKRQLEAWITVQRGHAVANSLPVLFSNRIGIERDATRQSDQFWGNSHVIGAQGEILAHGLEDEAMLIMAEVNLERTETLRRSWPFFRDRRVDLYQSLCNSEKLGEKLE